MTTALTGRILSAQVIFRNRSRVFSPDMIKRRTAASMMSFLGLDPRLIFPNCRLDNRPDDKGGENKARDTLPRGDMTEVTLFGLCENHGIVVGDQLVRQERLPETLHGIFKARDPGFVRDNQGLINQLFALVEKAQYKWGEVYRERQPGQISKVIELPGDGLEADELLLLYQTLEPANKIELVKGLILMKSDHLRKLFKVLNTEDYTPIINSLSEEYLALLVINYKNSGAKRLPEEMVKRLSLDQLKQILAGLVKATYYDTSSNIIGWVLPDKGVKENVRFMIVSLGVRRSEVADWFRTKLLGKLMVWWKQAPRKGPDARQAEADIRRHLSQVGMGNIKKPTKSRVV